MENASKALIIAGAILLTLLIIGLAMGVLNRMSGTISNANLNSEEAQAHNGKFQASFGENVSAKDVKALLQAIAANNVTQGTADELGKIAVTYGTFTRSYKVEEISRQIKNGYTYKVNVINQKSSDQDNNSEEDADSVTADTGYYKNGFIRQIKIEQNTRNSGATPST